MVHKQLNDGNYYSVGVSSTSRMVLLQLGDTDGEQVRVALTIPEAVIVVEELTEAIGGVVATKGTS